jgi:hypothetical protein
MDWDTSTAIVDLGWYFQQAEAACGCRSTFSGFESAMHRMALCGPAQEGQIHPHETRQGTRDDGATDERLASWERAREIHARLALVSAHDRKILELQFGDVVTMGNGAVSLSLACAQKGAISSHLKASSESRKAWERRRADLEKRQAIGHRERSKPMIKPKRKPPVHGRSTVRDWLLFLATSDDGREVLAAIVVEAQEQLERALASYRTASKQVAA